jgi:GNAT superfamily N-acetyltransferase
VRDPVPFEDGADPPGLEIVRVRVGEVEEFEAVSARGFGGEGSTVEAGAIHPPNPDPRMTLWLGRVEGEAVSAAMSYRTDQAVGIFGVATIEPARGRGYGSALTRRAALVETGLPAVLNTDNPAAARVYGRLEFRRVGECPLWSPGPVSRTKPDAVLT